MSAITALLVGFPVAAKLVGAVAAAMLFNKRIEIWDSGRLGNCRQ